MIIATTKLNLVRFAHLLIFAALGYLSHSSDMLFHQFVSVINMFSMFVKYFGTDYSYQRYFLMQVQLFFV